MSEPIKVGDLVMVVMSLCGNEGKIGTAEKFAIDVPTYSPGPRWWVRFPNPIPDTWGEYFNPAPVPVEWLKRIPPLEELEGQPTQEDIKEPA